MSISEDQNTRRRGADIRKSDDPEIPRMRDPNLSGDRLVSGCGAGFSARVGVDEVLRLLSQNRTKSEVVRL